MSVATETNQTWSEVISDFFSRKMSSDEEKYIKDLIKEIETDCKNRTYYGIDLLEQFFSQDTLKKEKQKVAIEFQRHRRKALLEIKNGLVEPIEVNCFLELDEKMYEEKIKEIGSTTPEPEEQVDLEEKYIKELIKQIEVNCKKYDYHESTQIKYFFSNDTVKKEKRKVATELLRQRIKALLEIKNDLKQPIIGGLFAELDEKQYEARINEISDKYDPAQWISKASKDAASVSFATHVSKLTHSKIDSPSIYDQVTSLKGGYVTTSSLDTKVIDGAVAGNQFSPVFQFLELKCNGVKLAAELSSSSSASLKEFSEQHEYLEWNKGFAKALETGNPASHVLAKQVFFPVKKTEGLESYQYHLLCNLKSSSMAQAVFERLFSDEAKENQKLFQDEKFSEFENRYFPRKGKISVTASNHSNASQLNGKRGGKLYLFSTAPPVWQSQPKPPSHQKSLFDSNLRHQVAKDDIDYLRDFLIRFDRIDLSIQHPERRKWINIWVGRIIDDVFTYAAHIQNLESGWTANKEVRLKSEHQLFLDPYRDDDEFQTVRKSNNWQSVVCEDFARWLIRVLVGKDKQFSPQLEHTRMWIQLMEKELREYDELISMDIKSGKVSA